MIYFFFQCDNETKLKCKNSIYFVWCVCWICFKCIVWTNKNMDDIQKKRIFLVVTKTKWKVKMCCVFGLIRSNFRYFWAVYENMYNAFCIAIQTVQKKPKKHPAYLTHKKAKHESCTRKIFYQKTKMPRIFSSNLDGIRRLSSLRWSATTHKTHAFVWINCCISFAIIYPLLVDVLFTFVIYSSENSNIATKKTWTKNIQQ